jgi:hypothetical protein
MAIKGYQGSDTYNEKIGIVQPSRGGEIIGQAMSRSGASREQFQYNKNVRKEEAKGEETASSLRTRNPETGKLEFQRMPAGMSPIAQRTAESLYKKRYIQNLTVDMDKAAKDIASQYPRDPEAFSKAYRNYINTTASTDTAVAAEAERIGEYYHNEYQAGVYSAQQKRLEDIAFDNSFTLFESQEDDTISVIKPMMETLGQFEDTIQEAKSTLQEDAREFAAEYAHKLEQGWLTKKLDYIERQFAFSRVEVAGSILTEMVEAKPESGSKHLPTNVAASYATKMQQAIQNGKILGDDKELFAQFGLTQEFLDGVKQEDRVNIASKMSTLQGSLVERHTQLMLESKVNDTFRAVEAGTGVTLDQGNDVMKWSGIDSSAKFAEMLPSIMNGSDDKSQKLGDMLKKSHRLPEVVTQFFDPDNLYFHISQAKDSRAFAQMAVNFYEQTTQTTTGYGTVFSGRNLSEKAIANMEVIKAISNSVNPTNIGDFIAQRSQPASAEMASNASKMAFGDKTQGEYFKKHFDVTPANGVKYQRAQELWNAHIGRFGEEITKQVVNQTLKRTMGGSKYFNQYAPDSQQSPEIVFSSDELPVFEQQTQANISLFDPNLKLGENAFVMPNPNSDKNFPSFIVVDENNMPLPIAGGKPLVVTSSMVEAQRKAGLTSAYRDGTAKAMQFLSKQIKKEQDRATIEKDLTDEQAAQYRRF